MANPPTYTPGYSFAAYQATDPVDPLPGIKVDAELNKISASINATITDLEDIRRSDSIPSAPHLNNGLVHWETLDASIQAMFGVPSWVGSAGLVLAPYAAQADAIAGTDPLKVMTPLTVAQAIGALAEGDAVASIAALRALNAPAFSRALVLGYYTARDGGGGDYVVDATDTTTADNGGTVIVSADGKRWKQILVTPLNVRQFGAKGDVVNLANPVSITSGSPALTVTGASFTSADVGKAITINGAGAAGAALSTTILAWVSATQVTLAANAGTTLTASTQAVIYGTDDTTAFVNAAATAPFGGAVYAPRGVYNITSLTLPDGVSLFGENDYASTISLINATGAITLGLSGQLRDLQVLCNVARVSANPNVIAIKNAPLIERVSFTGYALAVVIGSLTSPLTVNPRILNCRFSAPQVGSGTGAVSFRNFANARIQYCVGTGPTTGQQPDFGVQWQNGDTAFDAQNNFTLHGEAILLAPPAGYNLYALHATGSFYDSAGTISGGVAASSAAIVPAGNVFDTTFTGCWFGLSAGSEGCFVQGQGAGLVDGLWFNNCEFIGNHDAGLLISGANVNNFSVVGGGSAANVNYGVRVASASQGFLITNHRAGPFAGRVANNIGIQVDAVAANHYIITDNVVYGNTTGGVVDNGTGANKTVNTNQT